MSKLNFKNKWVVITGASSGLGKEIARYLAKYEKANLVIAARRVGKLENLKKEIEQANNTKVEIVEVDLSQSEGVDFLFNIATKIGPIYGIINNAGFTYYGKTEKAKIDSYEQIIDLNFIAVMKLSLLFLDYFHEMGQGGLLNITSMAAFIPIPYQNVYSASKHASQSFTDALREENRKTGIVISSFAPGGIATEMITKSGLDKKISKDSIFNMKPEKVAKKAIKAFKRGKPISVPGFMNKLTLFFVRIFPRKWIIRISGLLYVPPEK